MDNVQDYRKVRQVVVAGVLVFVAAVVLRVAAARGELWLDEVWSLRLVEEIVHSPSDVVLRLRHDNNHMLNSLVIYLIGPSGAAWQFRGPAVLAGVISVALAGWVQRRLSPQAGLAAMALVGFSYLLVHYSSEARGYAYLSCCMLLAYGALVHAQEEGKFGWELLVALSSVLGFLAHPLFVNLYLAIQVWTWCPDGKRSDVAAWRRLAVAAIFRTLLPGLFFGWLYWVNLGRMEIGGGDNQPYFQIVVQTLSLACGGPFSAPWSYLAAAATLAVSGFAWWHVAGQSLRRAFFYLTVIVVGPAILLVIVPRGDIYPRYFLGSVLFVYLMWSEWLGDLAVQRRHGRVWLAGLLVAFSLANGVHVWQLISLERGHYRAALELMEQETQSNEVNVALDHPFRHGLMLDYATRQMKLSKPLQTYFSDSGAEWLLIHDLDVKYQPPTSFTLEGGYDYQLVKEYPFAGLSGWNLGVYRRITR